MDLDKYKDGTRTQTGNKKSIIANLFPLKLHVKLKPWVQLISTDHADWYVHLNGPSTNVRWNYLKSGTKKSIKINLFPYMCNMLKPWFNLICYRIFFVPPEFLLIPGS